MHQVVILVHGGQLVTHRVTRPHDFRVGGFGDNLERDIAIGQDPFRDLFAVLRSNDDDIADMILAHDPGCFGDRSVFLDDNNFSITILAYAHDALLIMYLYQ